MAQALTTSQVLTVLRGIDETLRILLDKPEYQQIEAEEEFSRSNDFNLLDVIHALGEVEEAIESVEAIRNPNNGS